MKGANREAEMVQASLLRQLREAKPGQEDNGQRQSGVHDLLRLGKAVYAMASYSISVRVAMISSSVLGGSIHLPDSKKGAPNDREQRNNPPYSRRTSQRDCPNGGNNLATANVHVGCIATLDCRVARHHTGNRAEDQMNEPEVFSESSVLCAMKDCATGEFDDC
jgi:hypothetical protein